jgi:NADH:ubiquinone oxidoreductase subunit 3 (subunit A)
VPEGFDVKWAAVVIASGVGVVAIVGLFATAWLLSPKRPSADKGVAYESGIRPSAFQWSQINIRYYIYALLFLIFDVEAVFLFPWTVTFLKSADIVFYEMLLFLGILLFGLGWAWRKGALSWR